MALSDIVSISISTESAKVEQAGFGMPLILAADAPAGFTERVRFYTDLAGLDDDFASTTATYKMASAVFAQNPRPPTIAVGRLANKPTQKFRITPTVSNSTVYEMEVNGLLASYTSDSGALATEITAGLKAAIDLLAQPVTVTDNSTNIDIVANAAGAFFTVEAYDTSLLKVAQTHADPGLATDLDAILVEDHSWYAVLHPFNSKACVTAIAGWAESNKRLFIAQTQDSDVINLALVSDTGGSETVAKAVMSDFRTALIYHPYTGAFADGAWAGACLPLDPGSETWAFKTLAGVDAVSLTATQRTNALAKNANVYETVAGVNITEEGKVSGDEYIDVIRFRDWLEARISEEVFGALARMKKVPFTDGGISVIQGIIKAQLQAAVASGGIAADPAPTVTVPRASAVSANDKAARRLTGVKFDAVLAGAIHAVSISGVITL